MEQWRDTMDIGADLEFSDLAVQEEVVLSA
jgi:hypothetical protein